MCGFTYDDDRRIDRDWDRTVKDWDRCDRCGMHFSMCECKKSNGRRSGEVDIYGPDYPPC